MPRTDFSQIMADVAEQLGRVETVPETAGLVVEQAREALGATHAGLTMVVPGGLLRSMGADEDSVVVRADRLQHELEEGPCVQTSTTTDISVWSPDVATDQRWPRWGPRVAEMGLRSVLSSQLRAGDRLVGALNLYGGAVQAFDVDDAATAHLFAIHAAAALSSADRVENLRRALESRTVIGQAQGMLMERFGIDADTAFSALRRYSQHANIKLHDVADEITKTGRVPGQVDPPAS